jgi:hypothetical protein
VDNGCIIARFSYAVSSVFCALVSWKTNYTGADDTFVTIRLTLNRTSLLPLLSRSRPISSHVYERCSSSPLRDVLAEAVVADAMADQFRGVACSYSSTN